MIFLIQFFAMLLILAGVVLLLKPELVFGLISRNTDQLWLFSTAILLRLILGALLVYYAGVSNYPLAMTIIGWIAIFAGMAMLVMGRNRFSSVMLGVVKIVEPFGRIGSIVAALFGLFLFSAFN